jgi:membrane-associated phospholipid phosphatase
VSRYPSLRASEWICLGFFVYATALVPAFSNRPNLHWQPLICLLAAACLLLALAKLNEFIPFFSKLRDFIPIGLTLLAFREMEFFVPREYNRGYELAWMNWDRVFLHDWHVKAAIEALRPVLPNYLELCYLLVYGLPFFGIGLLYGVRQRPLVEPFLRVYLIGTLSAYALFPFFPSRPPRFAFPSELLPSTSLLRTFNLALLKAGTIHTGVFPSAHVSSAFAAAWGLLIFYPQEKRYGIGMLIYAISVALATVYGRYHYAADVVAGLVVSLVAGAVGLIIRSRLVATR